jgi:outer membrane lipopolysaccharide assembly protein LptE/RlpB
MKEKIFTLLLFLFLSSCGYEATYSLKNRAIYAFSISELQLAGDRQINIKTKQMFNVYSNTIKLNQGIEKIFALKISSNSEKITTTKDTSGDATKFKNEITLSVEVLMNGEYKSNFVITENFTYDNNSNTFELKNYEKQIKNNLTETAVSKIISKLSNIK